MPPGGCTRAAAPARVGRVSPSAGMHIRPMTAADVEAGLQLCRAARWNQTARDWHHFLERTPGGALVAVLGGRVVGSVATIRYAPDLAWVAMVLVDPDVRGRGIGHALLEHGLELVADVPCVGLDATPAGRPLYQSLGFTDADALTRMQRSGADVSGEMEVPGAGPGPAGLVVGRLESADWPEVLTLDRRVTGVERAVTLRWLAEGAGGHALGARQGGVGALEGVLLGRQGHQFEHLGPLLASRTEVAAALVSSALREVPAGRPVVVDAADQRPGWLAWLERRGFTAQRPFTRMYRGTSRTLAPETFAIIGPEFG